MTSSVSGSLGGTYGLSGSGIDVDAVVKKLMTSQQAVDDGLVQKKTVLQWQKSAYNTIYDDVNTFRNTVFNYKLDSTLSPNKVSSSNTSVVTASASASASDINHSLIVTKLAGGVNLTSSVGITPSGADKDTITKQLYGGTKPTGSMKVTIANGSASATITIDPSGSINDLVSQINNAGVNVNASYDSTLDRFFLSTTNTGVSSGISITDTNAGDTSGTSFFTDKLKISSLTSTGQDAAFTLDGASLTETGNSFTISGVTYNLTGVSAGTPPSAVSSISVTNDVDAAVASIQTLVDSYNKILSELNTKIQEKRYTDYPPLTDTQKSAMKDADITAWNEKAKSGMLHNDDTVTSLVNAMRDAISSPVSGITGKYKSASSIGITTGVYTEYGKLHLDTTKLKTALQDNPNVLNQLFGAPGTTTVNGKTTTDSQSQGIAGRLYDSMKKTMDKLNTMAGTTDSAQYDSSSNIAKEIISYNTQITDATNKFSTMQKNYYTQYNAMEVALQKLSAQSSWVSSQLGSTSG